MPGPLEAKAVHSYIIRGDLRWRATFAPREDKSRKLGRSR